MIKDRREYPTRPVIGVGGVVISHGRALLVRRQRPPLQGKWSIPGGALECGETLFEGVRRELAEETGVTVRVIELIDVFERIEFDRRKKTRYHFVVLDYLCQAMEGRARASSDASDVAWVRASEFEEYSLTPAATRVIQKALRMARRHSRLSRGKH